MTEPTKQQATEVRTVEEKIKAVNKILLDGEPTNISVDSYSGYQVTNRSLLSMPSMLYLVSVTGDLRK